AVVPEHFKRERILPLRPAHVQGSDLSRRRPQKPKRVIFDRRSRGRMAPAGLLRSLRRPEVGRRVAKPLDDVSEEPPAQVDDVDPLVQELSSPGDLPIETPLLRVARPAAVAVPAADIGGFSYLPLCAQFVRLPDRGVVAVIETDFDDEGAIVGA